MKPTASDRVNESKSKQSVSGKQSKTQQALGISLLVKVGYEASWDLSVQRVTSIVLSFFFFESYHHERKRWRHDLQETK